MTHVKPVGSVIAELRKKKNITQDELARHIGISAQAVSKWENGGMPDTELLPLIADFFEISIDELFGRKNQHCNITAAIFEHIRATAPDSEERFKTIFELCWDIERSIFKFSDEVDADLINGGTIKDYENANKPDAQQYSSILSDFGFTRMGIANRLQYFMLVPETKNMQLGLFENIDYIAFFKDISDPDVFNALLLLFKREATKAFTENLLVRELSIDSEKVKEVIKILKKYHLIRKTQLELDDELRDVYNFCPTPSFVSLLIFAREIIDPPRHFAFYSDGRNKPYLA